MTKEKMITRLISLFIMGIAIWIIGSISWKLMLGIFLWTWGHNIERTLDK